MGSFSTRIAWEQIRSINSNTFTGSFQVVGGPLLFPSFDLKFVNNSAVPVTVSMDGANTFDVLPATSSMLYVNHSGQEGYQTSVPQGTQFFVSGTASTGLFYIVSRYIVQI
jgi:hypothetical protein